MRQLFVERETLIVKEVCRPLLDDHFVLVSVSHSFMSSDEHLSGTIKNSQLRFLNNIPDKIRKIITLISTHGGTYAKQVVGEHFAGHIFPIGHSCSGVVLAIGKKVKQLKVGDLVACVGDGLANHADIVCVPEQLCIYLGNDETLLKSACLTGLGAIAMQSVRRSNGALGEIICVIGANALEQLIVQLAVISGCRTIVLDHDEAKLAYAKQSGAEQVYPLLPEKVHESIDAITRLYGVDCTIVGPRYCTDEGINLALDVTRKKGRVVLVGSHSIGLKKDHVQHKEIDICLSQTYGPGRYDADYENRGRDYPYDYVRWTENRNMQAFVYLLRHKKLIVDWLLENSVTIGRFADEIGSLRKKAMFGIVIDYTAKKDESAVACKITDAPGESYQPARRDTSAPLKVTFFGANKSARVWVMPIVNSIKSVAIHKIIDRDISRALNAAKQYRGAIALSGEPELFYDDMTTDVVYVASDYGLHVEHLIYALQRGKAVYLHRPFSFVADDIVRLNAYIVTNPAARLCFGYYRPAAPFMQKIKRYLSSRQSPLMLMYRLNLSAVDVQDTLDHRPRAGNVVDKASHIFDLFYFLAQSKPVSVAVEVMRSTHESVFPTDNFVAQISFSDGSIGVVQMTSLGSRESGIERMELHYDNKTICMDDFLRLTGYGLPQSFDEIVRIPDKGKDAFIRHFFNVVHSSEVTPLFDIQKTSLIAQLTMHVDRLVCQGGGEINLS